MIAPPVQISTSRAVSTTTNQMPENSQLPSRYNPQTLLSGICFAVLWSSAFSTARLIVIDAPPFLSLAVRFLISGLLGVGIAWWLGQKIALSRREWIAVGVLGVCQNTIYLGFCFVAVQWVQAGVVVVIASLLPLLVAPAHWLFMGERTSVTGILGLLAGLAGVIIIMSAKISGDPDPQWLTGVAFAIVGVLSLTAATLLVGGSFNRSTNLLMIVGLQMLVGCVTILPLSALFETWTVNWSATLGWAFAWTTLMPGLLATLIWFSMVGKIGPTRAAAFHFLNPFFGVAIAAWLLAEPLQWTDLIGVAIIMAGILAVQLSRAGTH